MSCRTVTSLLYLCSFLITLFTICRAMCVRVIGQEPLVNARMACSHPAGGTAQFVHKWSVPLKNGGQIFLTSSQHEKKIGVQSSNEYCVVCISAFVCIVVCPHYYVYLCCIHTLKHYEMNLVYYTAFFSSFHCVSYNI